MPEKNSNSSLRKTFEKIRNDLRVFISLSQKEDESSWIDWISSVSKRIDTKCWEKKNCHEKKCPAYHNPCGRCWIIAGTMLPGEIQCKFAINYESCQQCDVYREAVCRDPITEIEEYMIVLVHSLRSRQQELKEIATTDFLTDLYNRRFFESYIVHEYEKLKRTNKSIALMMIDINGFKGINDKYGHIVGDKILKECADILLKNTRQSDLLARYGGDEFVIALNENSDHENYPDILVSRIEEYISNRNASACQSTPAISLSFGYSILNKTNSITKVMEEADRRMYQDKKRKKIVRACLDGK